MKAIILVGGRGTRLAALYGDVPKALVPVAGEPVLARQLAMLRREGIRDVTLVCGHLARQIKDYCGDGEAFGMRIDYYTEAQPLGTAGALFHLDLREDFLLLNGDLVFDVDLGSMRGFHERNGAQATLFAHPSTHPFDSTWIGADAKGRVTAFCRADERPAFAHNLSNAGIAILSPELLSRCEPRAPMDLDRDVLRPNVDGGGIYAYRSFEYVKDMGTPQRLREVERDLALGIPEKRQKNRPHAAVFLDRDGTLNVFKGYISEPDEIELLDGAAEAVRIVNEKGYLAVLATNQPVVARGACTLRTLDDIHCRLEALLGAQGAYLDAIYFCPHHPDKGFAGENPLYKTDCACRKPKPGMLLRAAEELRIDLASSYMVGDAPTDVQTALNAGCRPVLLSENTEDPHAQGAQVFPDLLKFAETL
jgi:D-glycero-D-manno-heptose 1,7-bisphosphate phosphatase